MISKPRFDFAGRPSTGTDDSPVVITGGAQRLGLAAALELQKLGYQILITYRTKYIACAARKAAMENLTQSFATTYAPLVKVNSIAPAMLMFNPQDDTAYRERARLKALLDVAPGESEGVNAIRYILESRYITGKTIALDGGRHLAQAS
jgi:NAD(P)-dependent dehydrogenase (short-subunit alcohol dehydrogenase family)